MVRFRSSPAVRRRPFSLLEMLVAVSIAVVVALLVVKFCTNLQNVWQHAMARTNTHEDGRLALQLMAQDLQAALAQEDDRPGYDIRFHQPSSTQLWFVTDSPADSRAACTLVEVGYRLYSNSLQRTTVDQSSSSWNIYGNRDNPDEQAGYQSVINNVTSLEFTCYDEAMDPLTPNQATRLPAVVCIRLSVLDARDAKRWATLSLWNRSTFEKRTARTFWKTVTLR